MSEVNFKDLRQLLIANFDTIIALKDEKIASVEKQLIAAEDERNYYEKFAKDMTDKAVTLENLKSNLEKRAKQLNDNICSQYQSIIAEKDSLIHNLIKQLTVVKREMKISDENRDLYKSWSANEAIDSAFNVKQEVIESSQPSESSESLNAQINSLSHQNDTLLGRNERLSRDYEKLENEMKLLNERIDKQKIDEQIINQKNKVIESLDKQLNTANERYELSVRFTQDMVKKAETLEKLKTDFANKKWQLEVDMSSRITHFQELFKDKNDAQNNELNSLKKHLNSLLDENFQLKADVNKYKRDNQKITKNSDDQKRQYEGSVSCLVQQNTLLSNKNKQLIITNENTVKEMTAEMIGMKKEINTLNLTVKQLTDNGIALQNVIDERDKEVISLQKRIDANGTLESMKQQTDNVVSNYEKLCNDYKKAAEEIKVLKQQIADKNRTDANVVNGFNANIKIKQEIIDVNANNDDEVMNGSETTAKIKKEGNVENVDTNKRKRKRCI